MLFVCLEIFLARIIDVSISTFRMMVMVRKKSILTPILAFCEVFVWFIAARKALNTFLFFTLLVMRLVLILGDVCLVNLLKM